MHQGSISCLTLTDDQMVISGSTLGSISIAGLSCGQDVAILKSASAGTGDFFITILHKLLFDLIFLLIPFLV